MNGFEQRTGSRAEPTGSEPDLGLPRTARVRSRRDYLHVQQNGKRVQTRHFVIMLMPESRQRIGITVTRRVAGAVGRNRVKRLVREVFRRNRPLFPPECDVVVLARSGADRLDYAAVHGEVAKAGAAMLRALKGTS